MHNLTALIFDPDTFLPNSQGRKWNLTLRKAASAEELSSSLVTESADFIIVDMKLPKGANGLKLIAELRKQKPGIPILLLTAKSPTDLEWMQAAAEPLVEVMQTPVSEGKLFYHVTRLFQGKDQSEIKVRDIITTSVAELRNKNGRLDANSIAKVFGLTITDVAANVGFSRQALSKTPDSMNIQTDLRHFERIARSLLSVTGSMKHLKIWLNSPIESLDGHTPIEVLKLGKVQMLADWLEDARLGSPD